MDMHATFPMRKSGDSPTPKIVKPLADGGLCEGLRSLKIVWDETEWIDAALLVSHHVPYM